MPRKQSTENGILYTRSDYESLRRARRSLMDVLPILDKAGACGTDCEPYREIIRQTDAQLAAIEQHFMTPPPGA